MFKQVLTLLLICFSSASTFAQVEVASPPIPADVSQWEKITFRECVTNTGVALKEEGLMLTKDRKLQKVVSSTHANGRKIFESQYDYMPSPQTPAFYIYHDDKWYKYEDSADFKIGSNFIDMLNGVMTKEFKTTLAETINLRCRDKQ